MIYESVRKMTVKEQMAFDLGYAKAIGEIDRLTAERDEALRRAEAAVREIESMLMDTCDTSRCANMRCHLDQASCNPIWRGLEPGGEAGNEQ